MADPNQQNAKNQSDGDERRGQALRDAVPLIPADRLMIESDAPYLMPRHISPKPDLPSNRRNEPCTLPTVLRTVADLRNEDPVETAAQTVANSIRFFALPESPVPVAD